MASSTLDALARVLPDPTRLKAVDLAVATFDKYRDQLPMIPQQSTRATLLGPRRAEVVATRWAPGATTLIHDHGTSHCWILVLEGELTFENFTRNDDGSGSHISISRTSETHLHAGEVEQRNGPRELHRVRNAGNECAYTLQVYAPTSFTFSVVDEETSQLRLVAARSELIIDLTELKGD